MNMVPYIERNNIDGSKILPLVHEKKELRGRLFVVTERSSGILRYIISCSKGRIVGYSKMLIEPKTVLFYWDRADFESNVNQKAVRAVIQTCNFAIICHTCLFSCLQVFGIETSSNKLVRSFGI